MKEIWKEDPDGYQKAWKAFKDRAADFKVKEEWDALIYESILEVMVTKRPRQQVGDVSVFKDVEVVLDHMSNYGLRPNEATTRILIKAYAEEDLAVVRILQVYQQKLEKESELFEERLANKDSRCKEESVSRSFM
jgi:hypothetical protein